MTAPHNQYSYSTYSRGKDVPPDQGVFEESSTQKAGLGTRIAFEDGRVYRYAKNGATALAAGKFVKAGALVAQATKAVEAAVVVGNNSITLTTSSAITTATDGYLQIDTGSGMTGQQYKIKTCAANATTTTSTDFVLYDPIAVALTTSAYGSVFYNPYEQCEVCSAQTDIVLGVPPIVVTAEYYFWLQTWGPACVYNEGTGTAGYPIYISTSLAAGVTTVPHAAGSTTSYPLQLGQLWQTGVEGLFKMVNLMLMP